MFLELMGIRENFYQNSFKNSFQQSAHCTHELELLQILHTIGKKSTWRNDHRSLHMIIIKIGFSLKFSLYS